MNTWILQSWKLADFYDEVSSRMYIYMVLFHLSSERGTFITFIGRSANKMKTFLFDKCKIEVKNEHFNCKHVLSKLSMHFDLLYFLSE